MRSDRSGPRVVLPRSLTGLQRRSWRCEKCTVRWVSVSLVLAPGDEGGLPEERGSSNHSGKTRTQARAWTTGRLYWQPQSADANNLGDSIDKSCQVICYNRKSPIGIVLSRIPVAPVP